MTGTVRVTAPMHIDMPWCARCRRRVDGLVQYDHGAPFFAQCHGEEVEVQLAADGELPAGLVLFGEAASS